MWGQSDVHHENFDENHQGPGVSRRGWFIKGEDCLQRHRTRSEFSLCEAVLGFLWLLSLLPNRIPVLDKQTKE